MTVIKPIKIWFGEMCYQDIITWLHDLCDTLRMFICEMKWENITIYMEKYECVSIKYSGIFFCLMHLGHVSKCYIFSLTVVLNGKYFQLYIAWNPVYFV